MKFPVNAVDSEPVSQIAFTHLASTMQERLAEPNMHKEAMFLRQWVSKHIMIRNADLRNRFALLSSIYCDLAGSFFLGGVIIPELNTINVTNNIQCPKKLKPLKAATEWSNANITNDMIK